MSVYVLQGLRPWLLQRISAVYVAAFVIYAVIAATGIEGADYLRWREWLFAPVNTIASGLFVLALLLHAWIGMRDIVLDYSHNTLVRMLLLSLIGGVLIGSGLWALRVLLITVTP
jgi:succinate dehydrogenase / fumarate reductase membrane anchor subunit